MSRRFSFTVADNVRGSTTRPYLDEALLEHIGSHHGALAVALMSAYSVACERNSCDIDYQSAAKMMIDISEDTFGDEEDGLDSCEETRRRVDELIKILNVVEEYLK